MILVEIGGMEYLESLDLFRNNLSGEIHQTMANLTFLGDLNPSYVQQPLWKNSISHTNSNL